MLDSRRNITLACALGALAGYVDGIGFLHLGGLFVSFMSGNSTRLGVGLAAGHCRDAAEALGVIGLFVGGRRRLPDRAGLPHQPPDLGAAGGGVVACRRRALLCLWAACAAVAAIVLAMGLENAVFQTGGDTGLGLTYVTGTLVKVGQLAAAALKGGPHWDWVPNLLLWAALVAGSVAGAVAYHWINLAAIWFAAGAALAMSAIVAAATRSTPA
jgi:uncharacterized membrane protein YoaK (UPF0700 family)